jgi:predicted  nucleic acid-binding Zn-ribbon protein
MSEKVITVTPEDQRKSNPKAAMVRAEVRSARGYANQRAHDLRIGPQPDYVDESRSYLNRILMPPPPAPEMRRMVEERRAQRETSRSLKSNAGIAVIGIVGFGIEAAQLFGELTTEQQDAAVLEAGRRIAEIANTTMVGAVIHLDETSTHAHLSFCGYDLDGVPLSSTMKRGMLTQFQDVLAEVMSEHCPGIERGNSKWGRIKSGANYAETVHKSVRELHQDLPKDIAKKREELEQVSAEIPKLEARVAEMQARVDKLEAEEKQRELTAAKVRRLRVYRSRLTDRIGDLRMAREELNSLTAQITEKQKLVTDLESRANQAEEMATRATERAQEAELAAEAEEGRKSEAEASVAALEAEKATLVAEVSNLTDARDQIKPDVTFLQNKKERLSFQARQAEAKASAAQKQAAEAQLEARALLTQKNETQASVTALSARRDEIRLNAQKLLAAKKKITGDLEGLKQSVQTETERNQTLKADNAALRRQSQALERKIGDVRESLEFLRPALVAADFLQQVSVLDPAEQDSAWNMVITPPRECDPLEYASALRMIDPLFAPEIPVRRSTIADENLETLHECDPEDYWAIVDAVRAEEGAESGIEALAEGAVYLDKTGTIAPSDPDQGSSGLFAKTLGWVRNTFEGVKRGVGLALAATRAGISEELTAARANLFNAFEPKLQSALRRLLKAETGHKSLERERPDLEHDPSDDFEP